MINVQLKNGYTSIANEVMEQLCHFCFDGSEIRIILFVLRKTWGWHKKEDKISYGQIATGTDISRRRVIRTVNRLVSSRTLLVKKGKINTLQFNKNYDEWVVSRRPLPSVTQTTTLVSQKTPVLVSRRPPTKETIKETITKEISTNVLTGFGNPDINEISNYFLQVMKLPKEDCPVQKSRRYWNSLLKENGRGVDGVKKLIDLAGQDEWYKNNISSSMDLYYKRMKLVMRRRGAVPLMVSMKKEVT